MVRIFKRALIVFALCLANGVTFGQDIHFSQFNAAPLFLNPALTGVNTGNYRIVANYKAQWTQLAPYNTVAASYDMSLFRNTPKSNYGGVGLSFFNDQAGDLSLRTTQVNLFVSYTVLLNKKGQHSLSTGIFGGLGQRAVNFDNAEFDNFDPVTGAHIGSPELSGSKKILYADIGAGFLWNFNHNENTNFYLGGSVMHLNQANFSFLGAPDEKLYVKFTAHGGGHFSLSKQLAILPSFLFLNQGPHREFNIGALVKVKKSPLANNNTSFYVGGWYRLKDALIATMRVDIGGFNIGFSYDVNISGLTPASNANGGPELSLIYTGFFPNKKHQIKYCPTL